MIFLLLLCYLNKWFSNFYVFGKTLGIWPVCTFWLSRSGWGSSFGISNKFPGDADAAGQGSTEYVSKGLSHSSFARSVVMSLFGAWTIFSNLYLVEAPSSHQSDSGVPVSVGVNLGQCLVLRPIDFKAEFLGSLPLLLLTDSKLSSGNF